MLNVRKFSSLCFPSERFRVFKFLDLLIEGEPFLEEIICSQKIPIQVKPQYLIFFGSQIAKRLSRTSEAQLDLKMWPGVSRVEISGPRSSDLRVRYVR